VTKDQPSSSPTLGTVSLAPFSCRLWTSSLQHNVLCSLLRWQRNAKVHEQSQTWTDEVENLYRFQQAGYRDELEYKQVKQVDLIDRWPETGFVKKLQRRDNTFYYYNRKRECEDREVHKVKVYAY
uniref:Meiosis/spermiogenesis associated 1 n=1 Tax=Salmo trutta TaxID=8032 RepID=A0A674E123_SALTR